MIFNSDVKNIIGYEKHYELSKGKNKEPENRAKPKKHYTCAYEIR